MDRMKRAERMQRNGSPAESGLGQRAGELFFTFQRFCIRRLWTIIALTLGSQIGGFIARRQFGEQYEPWGENGIYIVLLLIGLMIFWIVPSRALFMRRLVWILLLAGALTLGITFLLALSAKGSVDAAWHAMDTYWMTPLGWQWLFGGLGLAAIMWGGLLIRNRVARADRRRARAERDHTESSQLQHADRDSRSVTEPDQPDA